mmetsp:Transcript_52494/g.85765  ORF Transcript_52494/g.85765 Transcript_52494/m.85765 type:complete len:305 (-) Transcript_52494:603-1517(-)
MNLVSESRNQVQKLLQSNPCTYISQSTTNSPLIGVSFPLFLLFLLLFLLFLLLYRLKLSINNWWCSRGAAGNRAGRFTCSRSFRYGRSLRCRRSSSRGLRRRWGLSGRGGNWISRTFSGRGWSSSRRPCSSYSSCSNPRSSHSCCSSPTSSRSCWGSGLRRCRGCRGSRGYGGGSRGRRGSRGRWGSRSRRGSRGSRSSRGGRSCCSGLGRSTSWRHGGEGGGGRWCWGCRSRGCTPPKSSLLKFHVCQQGLQRLGELDAFVLQHSKHLHLHLDHYLLLLKGERFGALRHHLLGDFGHFFQSLG